MEGLNTILWCDGMTGEAASTELVDHLVGNRLHRMRYPRTRIKCKGRNMINQRKKRLKKHCKINTVFIPMQNRIWAEMHVAISQVLMKHLQIPCMFLRAGVAAVKRRTAADNVSQAISQLAPASLSPSVTIYKLLTHLDPLLMV